MKPPKKGERIVVTKLMTKGGPCGDVEVQLVQVSRNKAELRCGKCDAHVDVSLPRGQIDLVGFAALEDGVRRLHWRDA